MFARIIRKVQQKLGLTRSESAVIIFLCLGLILGASAKLMHLDKSTARYDFNESDSFFKESSSKIDSIIALEEDSSGRSREKTDIVTPVDINNATAGEMLTVPGIGPVTAGRIVEYRATHGKFQSIDDLINVKGIGKAKLEQMRPHLKAE